MGARFEGVGQVFGKRILKEVGGGDGGCSFIKTLMIFLCHLDVNRDLKLKISRYRSK
jgi:hypothetical protein